MPDTRISAPADDDPALVQAYTLDQRAAIVSVLRKLINERGSLTLSDGQTTLPSMLLAIEGERMLLDVLDDPAVVRHAVQLGTLQAVGHDGKVEVRFRVDGIRRAMLRGSPALEADLPQGLVRLQRRDHYRLTIPLSLRPICMIPWKDGRVIEATIFDISGGGLALIAYKADDEIPPGTVIGACRITLPDTEDIVVTLEIRHTHEVVGANGARVRHSGCTFVSAQEGTLRSVHRYILRVEAQLRNQRARGR